jgi:alternative sigma factor RpoH
LRIPEGRPAAPRRTHGTPKAATNEPQLRSVEDWEEPKPASAHARAVVPERPDSPSKKMMTYFQDLRKHPLLTREEEQRIALELATTGDQRLASRLVTANLRLVVKIALEYRTARHNLLDLVQEGNLGLIHAVQKYDPHRGVKLATYASWWIRAYILKFILSNARLVKLGTTQAQRRLFFGMRREKARLAGRDGTAVGAQQLAAAFAVSEQEVVEMERRLSAHDASLDWPSRGDDDERTLGDVLSTEPTLRPDVLAESQEFSNILGRELRIFQDTLTGRDAEIFNGRLVCEDVTTLAEPRARAPDRGAPQAAPAASPSRLARRRPAEPQRRQARRRRQRLTFGRPSHERAFRVDRGANAGLGAARGRSLSRVRGRQRRRQMAGRAGEAR